MQLKVNYTHVKRYKSINTNMQVSTWSYLQPSNIAVCSWGLVPRPLCKSHSGMSSSLFHEYILSVSLTLN